MLTTLITEEFRTQAPRNAVLAGIILLVSAASLGLASLEIPLLSQVLMLLGLLAAVALPPAVGIQMAIEYWQTMSGDRAYLTMSLPVRGRSIFAAKITYAALIILVSTAISMALFLWWLAILAEQTGSSLTEILTPMREAVGTTMLTYFIVVVLLGLVAKAVQLGSIMSIGAQGRWNHLGLGAPAIGLVLLYVASQALALVLLVLIPFSYDLTTGSIVWEWMLPSFIESVTADAEPTVIGLGVAATDPLIAAGLAWWAVHSIERHTCLR